MAHDITHNERFWFIMFTIWCQRTGRDHTTSDFNLIKQIPDKELDGLALSAGYAIVKSWQCPRCLEKFTKETANFKQIKKTDKWTMVCPSCTAKISIDVGKNQADWEEPSV
jgi:hypothetical protein